MKVSGFGFLDLQQKLIRRLCATNWRLTGRQVHSRYLPAPLVRNSETIFIETRDRFRADQILSTTPLIRYVDYDIDYQTGELVFRLPIPAATSGLDINAIIVEYETSAPV